MTRKVSVDLECCDTIEFGRRSEGLDARSSSCKRDETCHRSFLGGERGVTPIAAGAGLLRREQASGPRGGAAGT